MKYCLNCKKSVNTARKIADMGFAEIWNDHCEECGHFIDSGFEHKKDLVFNMAKGGKVELRDINNKK